MILVTIHHADKFDDKNSFTSEEGEEIFKSISNAYESLRNSNTLLQYISVEFFWNYITS